MVLPAFLPLFDGGRLITTIAASMFDAFEEHMDCWRAAPLGPAEVVSTDWTNRHLGIDAARFRRFTITLQRRLPRGTLS